MTLLSTIKRFSGYAFLSVIVFLVPLPVYAVFNEQLAIDAKAAGLANACTADPPSLMCVHYNPAGLSLLDEGKTFQNGLALPYIQRTGTFTPDPNFKGFASGYWGNDESKYPHYDGKKWTREDDPNSDHGGPDPLNNTHGRNTSGRMYIPFYRPINFIGGPNLGIASREKDSKWTFAYANYAPWAGGFTHGSDNDPLKFGGKSMYEQQLIYAAPSVSYSISDTLSIGGSIGMGQRAFGLEQDIRNPGELIAMTRVIGDATRKLEIPVVSEQTLPPPWLGGGLGPYENFANITLNARDDFVPSYNLGLLWRPNNWFSYGFCYQSESVAECTGKYVWTYSEQFQRQVQWNSKTPMTMESAGMLDLPINGIPFQTGTVTATRTLPMRVQNGVMFRPIPKLKILFDLQYANWSVMKEDRLIFDQRIQLLRIAKLTGYQYNAYTLVAARNMKDTWHWSIGTEFEVNDKLTLRCGYERRPMSTSKDLADSKIFIPDATNIGAGLGLKLPNGTTVNLAVAYLFAKSTIKDNSSSNFSSWDFTEMGNPYIGLDYSQDLKVITGLLSMTMPLEVQLQMLKHQQEMLHHSIEKIKGLFRKLLPFGKKDEKKLDTEKKSDTDVDSTISKKENTKTKEEDDFDKYLEKLSAEYN